MHGYIRSRTSPCRAAIRACAASARSGCRTAPTVARRSSSGCMRVWSEKRAPTALYIIFNLHRHATRRRRRGIALRDPDRPPCDTQYLESLRADSVRHFLRNCGQRVRSAQCEAPARELTSHVTLLILTTNLNALYSRVQHSSCANAHATEGVIPTLLPGLNRSNTITTQIHGIG